MAEHDQVRPQTLAESFGQGNDDADAVQKTNDTRESSFTRRPRGKGKRIKLSKIPGGAQLVMPSQAERQEKAEQEGLSDSQSRGIPDEEIEKWADQAPPRTVRGHIDKLNEGAATSRPSGVVVEQIVKSPESAGSSPFAAATHSVARAVGRGSGLTGLLLGACMVVGAPLSLGVSLAAWGAISGMTLLPIWSRIRRHRTLEGAFASGDLNDGVRDFQVGKGYKSGDPLFARAVARFGSVGAWGSGITLGLLATPLVSVAAVPTLLVAVGLSSLAGWFVESGKIRKEFDVARESVRPNRKSVVRPR